MTSSVKTMAIMVALATILGLGAGSLFNGAASARPREYVYDIDKEDAQFGDYSGWNGDLEAEDARAGIPLVRSGVTWKGSIPFAANEKSKPCRTN